MLMKLHDCKHGWFLGKLSEEPAFGGIYKLKYAALKTESMPKPHVENSAELYSSKMKVIWLHM